jgi:hypothetical protein
MSGMFGKLRVEGRHTDPTPCDGDCMNFDPGKIIEGLMADLGWVLPVAAGLVTLWCLALLGFGALTGWRRLASRYPAVPFRGKRILPGWVIVRRLGYRNLIVMRASETHLHVKLWLRLGHPPFSVPWGDVRAERESTLGRRNVVLSFAREPGVTFNVYGTIAERLAIASSGRLQIPG